MNLGGSVRVGRGAAAVGTGTLTMSGSAQINSGDGIVVGRGDVFSATGTFTIGGTAKYLAGNSMGDGDPGGLRVEGFFSVANNANSVGHVTVKDSAVVCSVRRMVDTIGNVNLLVASTRPGGIEMLSPSGVSFFPQPERVRLFIKLPRRGPPGAVTLIE